MAKLSTEQLEQYIVLVEDERERRPAEAALVDEIKRLRELIREVAAAYEGSFEEGGHVYIRGTTWKAIHREASR